jgi:hypothetical protein
MSLTAAISGQFFNSASELGSVALSASEVKFT